jgi:hypothetical protein
MKYFRIVCVLFIVSAFPMGFQCGPCFEVRCAEHISFRLIDASAKKNLILGPDAIYKYDSISFRYAKGRSLRQGYDEFPVSMATASEDDIMIRPYELVDTLLLRLTYQDYDTLLLSFRMGKSECCANGFYELDGIRFNGKVALRDNKVFHKPFVFEK